MLLLDGKLHFRIPGNKVEGVLRRQAENVYAINDNTEARFVMSGGRAEWSMGVHRRSIPRRQVPHALSRSGSKTRWIGARESRLRSLLLPWRLC